MEYNNLIDLVNDAIKIDLLASKQNNCENTLENSFVWINLRGNNVICKTEVYHSWCKDIAKEVRILNNGYISKDVLPLIYRLIEEISEEKYCELYGK